MDDFPADGRAHARRADAPGVEADQRRAGAATTTASTRDEIDLSGVIATLWREKIAIAAFGFGFAFLSMFYVYSLTPLYRSSAVVMLDRSEEKIIDVQSVVSGITPDFYAILAEVEVLRSRKLMDRVVTEAELEKDPWFNPELAEEKSPPFPLDVLQQGFRDVRALIRGAVSEKTPVSAEELDPSYWVRQTAIDNLLDALTITSIDETYVYDITIETPDPRTSAKIANTIARLYILDQLEGKFEATQAATTWLSNRVAQLKDSLEKSEAAVEEFNSSTTLISEKALAAMSRQLKEMREREGELTALVAERLATKKTVNAALDAGDRTLAAQLLGSPRLIGLAADIEGAKDDAARAAFVRNFDAEAVRQLRRLDDERERAAAQLASVTRTIAEIEGQIETQTKDLVQLRQLQREADANRRIYEQFLQRLNETSVQQGIQQPDARILSPAVVSIRPSYPNKTVTVLMFGFIGGIAGIMFVLLMELRNNSFRTAEELEQGTGLPVLGSIPTAPVRKRRSMMEYAVERSNSAMMESIRNLRTSVLMANIDRTPQVVTLTSSLPKEGKTTCSLLLAQNAAGLGKRVLLMECDLRRRVFKSYFDVPSRKGLLAVLSGDMTFEEVVHRDERTGVDVLIGEETKANAADVFSSQRFADLMKDLRGRYDLIVIDTPPVLAVPDARVIARLSDALIYCVRWNVTHRDLVRAGLAAFTQIGVRVTGLALTQIDQRKMARYGYGGYSYQYYRSSNRYYLN